MGAMGEFAGHERRGSLTWPGRSALIGLMAAAKGIRRDGDFSALDRLRMAVAVLSPGSVLRDYHTIESVPGAAARLPQSRPQALRDGRGRTNTAITLRDYRVGAAYGVAVWGDDLAGLGDALRRPCFTLYLGRKSCPLSAPLNPQLVTAKDAGAALATLSLPGWHRGARATLLASDEAPTDAPGDVRRETRHDIPADRRAWHFAPRQVAMLPVDIAPGAAW